MAGLAVVANQRLGDLDVAAAAAAEGSMIATRSPLANADFWLHVASLRIVQQRSRAARKAIDHAMQLLAGEFQKPEPSAKESRRRRRSMQSAVAAAAKRLCVMDDKKASIRVREKN